jgi:hypothetical protein
MLVAPPRRVACALLTQIVRMMLGLGTSRPASMRTIAGGFRGRHLYGWVPVNPGANGTRMLCWELPLGAEARLHKGVQQVVRPQPSAAVPVMNDSPEARLQATLNVIPAHTWEP